MKKKLASDSLRGFCLKKFKAILRRLYFKEQFYPGFIGLLINPFYFARKGLACHISELANYISGTTLDVGCGTKPYQKLFSSSTYLGLEIDTPSNRAKKQADFFYDGNVFPFDNQKFDCLVVNQVFEHVFNPDDFLDELNRVLRMGGHLLVTVPFVWDEHEQPYDFARYSSFGLKAILEKHGFEILEQKKSMNDIRVIFQLINAYIFKKTITKSPFFNVLTTLVLMAPFNILGEIVAMVTPKNADLYLDNIVLAKKQRNNL